MKQGFLFVVLAVAIVGVVTVLSAAPPSKPSSAPALTPVTAAVEGFSCPSCVAELQKYLSRVKGVTEVKATLKPPQVTAKIDEKVITISQFINTINQHALKTEPENPYKATMVAYVGAADCANEKKMCDKCFTAIPKALKSVKGVTAVSLDATGRVATVTFDARAKIATSALAAALKKADFTASFTAQATATAASTHGGSCCPMD